MCEFDRKLVAAMPLMEGFAYFLTGDRAKVADLRQATLLRALEYRDRYQEEGKFDAWWRQIMRTLNWNEGRKVAHRAQNLVLNAMVLYPTDGVETDPDLAFWREVNDAMNRVSDAHREILFKDVMGSTYQEIADDAAIALGTVKSRLNRAREAVRRELEAA